MTESAGARLKKIRLEKGLSLEEAHKKTKIHLNILRAIEEDSLIDFSPVYIKGFLKIYCKFLGQDPKDYITGYKEPRSKVEYVSGFKHNKPAPLFKIRPLTIPYLKAIRHINPKVIFIAILFLAFVIILFNLGKIFSLRHSLTGQKKPSLAAAAVIPKAENKAQIARAQESAAVRIIRLDIRAKENCLIHVKADGKVMFQGILRKGRSESWQAMNKIELSLGNAGAVELEVNGKRIQGLGRKGQTLKNILITKEGLSIKR